MSMPTPQRRSPTTTSVRSRCDSKDVKRARKIGSVKDLARAGKILLRRDTKDTS
jgi:hypothetical protein